MSASAKAPAPVIKAVARIIQPDDPRHASNPDNPKHQLWLEQQKAKKHDHVSDQ